jgi:hypothetical protein
MLLFMRNTIMAQATGEWYSKDRPANAHGHWRSFPRKYVYTFAGRHSTPHPKDLPLMPLTRRYLALLATTLALIPAVGSAQAFRTYLSLEGNDTSPCTLQLPCRLLPAALAAVADGGEIWMLDSANYNGGPVAITKSVTILAIPGALGSLVALGGNAVEIATAGARVTLRNLNIAPFSAASASYNGVRMTAGAALSLDRVNVRDFTAGRGVWVTTPAKVSVLDSTFRNYAVGLVLAEGAQGNIVGSTFEQGSSVGINISSTIAGVSTLATITRSVISKSNSGILGEVFANTAAVRVYVHDSVMEYNNDAGVATYVGSYSGSVADVTVSNSMIVTSGYCLRSQGSGARAWVSASTLNNCTNGLYATSGGAIESAGNNMVRLCSSCAVGVTTVGTQ